MRGFFLWPPKRVPSVRKKKSWTHQILIPFFSNLLFHKEKKEKCYYQNGVAAVEFLDHTGGNFDATLLVRTAAIGVKGEEEKILKDQRWWTMETLFFLPPFIPCFPACECSWLFPRPFYLYIDFFFPSSNMRGEILYIYTSSMLLSLYSGFRARGGYRWIKTWGWRIYIYIKKKRKKKGRSVFCSLHRAAFRHIHRKEFRWNIRVTAR